MTQGAADTLTEVCELDSTASDVCAVREQLPWRVVLLLRAEGLELVIGGVWPPLTTDNSTLFGLTDVCSLWIWV